MGAFSRLPNMPPLPFSSPTPGAASGSGSWLLQLDHNDPVSYSPHLSPSRGEVSDFTVKGTEMMAPAFYLLRPRNADPPGRQAASSQATTKERPQSTQR